MTAHFDFHGVYRGHTCNFCCAVHKMPPAENAAGCRPALWTEVLGICVGYPTVYDVCPKCQAKGVSLTPEGHPPHFWLVCGLCGPAVRCGACLNSSCNCGIGRLPLGTSVASLEGIECPYCRESWKKGEEQPPAEIEVAWQDLRNDPNYRKNMGFDDPPFDTSDFSPDDLTQPEPPEEPYAPVYTNP